MSNLTYSPPFIGITSRKSLWILGKITISTLILVSLSGCSIWFHILNGKAQRLVSAEPLAIDSKQLTQLETGNDDTAKKEFLGSVVLDSEGKCQNFLNSLVIAQNTTNTGGDVTALVLNGLASVFRPLTTVHALTASSSAVTGTKASVNANIYNNASIVNFQTALSQSYGQAVRNYTDALPNIKNVIVNNELSKIQAIHSMCTLSATETTILAKLSTTTGQSLAKPQGVKATQLNAGVQLTWNSVDGASSYSVFQGTMPGVEGNTPIASAIQSPNYTVMGLTNGTTYYFEISAQNSTGSSSPKSDETQGTPSASAGPAAQPPPSPASQTHAPVPGKSQ